LLLSRIGVDVLRFDYSAHGNSSGDCADVGPERWQLDILDSLDMLRKLSNPSRVTVIAMRLGATLAANTRMEGVDDLILIDPVRCGDAYLSMLDEFDQTELAGMSRYDRVRRPQIKQLHGQRTSQEKRDAIAKLHLPTVDFSAAKKTLVLTSHRYEDGEGLLPIPSNWNTQPCRDEIGWHRQQFTHAAFASADLYRNVLTRVKS